MEQLAVPDSLSYDVRPRTTSGQPVFLGLDNDLLVVCPATWRRAVLSSSRGRAHKLARPRPSDTYLQLGENHGYAACCLHVPQGDSLSR